MVTTVLRYIVLKINVLSGKLNMTANFITSKYGIKHVLLLQTKYKNVIINHSAL